jgi:predicted Rossmann fold nucleotide-binding protein DprA/Smf involved in DNA uptake
MTPERRDKILTTLSSLDTENIDRIIEQKNIQLITIDSPLYPERLATIKQSPYFLYVRGDLRSERKMLGVV